MKISIPSLLIWLCSDWNTYGTCNCFRTTRNELVFNWFQSYINVLTANKHFAVLAWCVSPKSKAPQNLNISTAKYFHRNKQIKKLYCYYNTESVTCRCIKRSYDKWSNSYSIATVAQQPTFNCWSFFSLSSPIPPIGID